ncbi:MAG: hypothetical protein ACR2JY_15795 [Chloroflexota bacterium]
MELASLAPATLEKIRSYRYDRIIEKHEGPEGWDSVLEYYEPEFLVLGGHTVLLPVGKDQHPNITLLRSIVGDGGGSLTLFLKDTTYCSDPNDAWICAGFAAVCDRMPGEDFFIAIFYHEWFIVDPVAPLT